MTTTTTYNDISRDLKQFQARAESETEAVPAPSKMPVDDLLAALQDSLSTELVCQLRYEHDALRAEDLGAETIAEELAQHAKEEGKHARSIAARMIQLGGHPSFLPGAMLERSHVKPREHANLEGMLRENLVAERVAVLTYRRLIEWVGEKDPTTRRLFESILEDEEEHADDIGDFMNRLSLFDGKVRGAR